jgi:hypothetical protein
MSRVRRCCRGVTLHCSCSLADERRADCARADRDERPFGGAGIELVRVGEAGFRVGDHLVPVCHPAHRARHREDRGEHRRRQPQRAEDDAGIEIDIGIELALDEVFVGEDDALQFPRRRVRRSSAGARPWRADRSSYRCGARNPSAGTDPSCPWRAARSRECDRPNQSRPRSAARLGWRLRAAVPTERRSPLRCRRKGWPVSSRRSASPRLTHSAHDQRARSAPPRAHALPLRMHGKPRTALKTTC